MKYNRKEYESCCCGGGEARDSQGLTTLMGEFRLSYAKGHRCNASVAPAINEMQPFQCFIHRRHFVISQFYNSFKNSRFF